MNTPDYANDEIYQKIVELCSMLGLRVEYADLSDDIYARTDKYRQIQMSATNIYANPEQAGKILAHELAHTILEHMPTPQMDESGKILDETNCDMIGDAFYQFAELAVARKYDNS